MSVKILIMGLPGSGKTTLAAALKSRLENAGNTVAWFNADQVRKEYDDWDFSDAGRQRQASRMRQLADESDAEFVIADFVAPSPSMRDMFNAEYLVWVDTISAGRYEDTNQAFIAPEYYDVRVTEQDSEQWSNFIFEKITLDWN